MSVFALILAIESLLLIPTALRFEAVEVERAASRIQLALEPALMLSPGFAGEGPIVRDLATLLAQNRLEALAVHAMDGELIAAISPSVRQSVGPSVRRSGGGGDTPTACSFLNA